jgi:TRAP-type uncharacterized transport system substrate-binding protein
MKPGAGPRIDRQIELHLMGDWGWANIHRVCGWLGSQVLECAPPGSRYAIWSTPYVANETVFAVSDGKVDMAFSTPAHHVANAIAGVGPYEGKKVGPLLSLGTFPQTDSLILAIDKKLGIKTFDDIRKKMPPLHISTQGEDGVNNLGYAIHRLLESAGLPRAQIEEWGGSFVEAVPPDQCCKAVRDGRANAIFYEAIMTPYWRNLARDFPLNFIPFERHVLESLYQRYGWKTNVVPAGLLTGLDQPLEALDWSDWLSMVRPEFPDDVAYAIAWAACNTTEIIERQYRHLPPQHSPLTYPLDPRKIAQTAIPLHPGAERYYKEAGYI